MPDVIGSFYITHNLMASPREPARHFLCANGPVSGPQVRPPNTGAIEKGKESMPQNKRESLIFTVIMCFCMVLWMSVYNVSRTHGWEVSPSIVAEAWVGFPPAYVVAMLLDVFVASRFAKWFAFRFLVTPGMSSKLAITLAISTMMVFPMVFFMSLYGALEAFTHTGNLAAVPMMWLTNIPWNFIAALPWNLLIAGPFSRWLFRRVFPEGTVLETPLNCETA